MIVGTQPNPLVMEIVTDPEEVAKAREQRERFQRNLAWHQAHIPEISAHRGKFFCVAGQQLFVADTLEDALAQAIAAFPEDAGRFTGYVPRQKMDRIYANQRRVDAV